MALPGAGSGCSSVEHPERTPEVECASCRGGERHYRLRCSECKKSNGSTDTSTRGGTCKRLVSPSATSSREKIRSYFVAGSHLDMARSASQTSLCNASCRHSQRRHLQNIGIDARRYHRNILRAKGRRASFDIRSPRRAVFTCQLVQLLVYIILAVRPWISYCLVVLFMCAASLCMGYRAPSVIADVVQRALHDIYGRKETGTHAGYRAKGSPTQQSKTERTLPDSKQIFSRKLAKSVNSPAPYGLPSTGLSLRNVKTFAFISLPVFFFIWLFHNPNDGPWLLGGEGVFTKFGKYPPPGRVALPGLRRGEGVFTKFGKYPPPGPCLDCTGGKGYLPNLVNTCPLAGLWGLQNGAQMEPKWDPKSTFGTFWDPWTQAGLPPPPVRVLVGTPERLRLLTKSLAPYALVDIHVHSLCMMTV